MKRSNFANLSAKFPAIVMTISAFVTLLEIAEPAGVVEPTDFFSKADDATDRFDGQHEG